MYEDKIFVPPLKIQGIKTKLVPLIKQNVAITQNTVWIEPFMGSGVVGLNVAPTNAIFADTNPHIISFYNQIQEGSITPHIVRNYLEKEGEKLSRYDDKYYLEVRERFNDSPNSLDFLFLNRSCFNGMMRFNRNNKFNVPYGHKPERFSKAYITKIVNQISFAEMKIKTNNWKFVCQSFEETISSADENAFVYCDPPYIGRHVDYYDSWDEKKELKLCENLKEFGGKFMVSTWDYTAYRHNEYINAIWSFCHKINKEHFYHVGAKEINRNTVVEALLMNYVPKNNCNEFAMLNQQLSLFNYNYNVG